jgi:ABC-2 type transport system permease protein
MSWLPVYAVLEREVLRMARQRARLLSAMVRPLIWLFVIGAGFGAVMQGAGTDYQRYLVPGIVGMTLLFGAMLAALSMVFDKESGVMRMLIVAPMARAWVVVAKLLSSALAAIVQALLLLAVLAACGYVTADTRFGLLALGLLATAAACGGIGMLVAAFTRTLDNYAAIMNFVIFPVFFLSGSLYPVERLPAALKVVALANPYTYGVDLLKHAFGASQPGFGADFGIGLDLAVLAGFTAAALAVASWRFSRESAHEPLIHRLTGKAGG